MANQPSPSADLAAPGGHRSGIRLALALITVVACWIAAYLAVVKTGKNTPLPWTGLTVCGLIGFGAVAAAGTSLGSRCLLAAWSAISWSLACAVAYLSKTDIMFGHHRGPFAWTQAATIGSWIGWTCIVVWGVVRFGIDRRRWSWRTLMFGATPLLAAGLLLVSLTGDFVNWEAMREREELSDPHSPRGEIRYVDLMRREAERGNRPPESYRYWIDNTGRNLQTPEGKAHWKQWEEEAKRAGKLPP